METERTSVRYKRQRGFLVKCLFAILSTAVVWRVGTTSSVSAQAKTKLNPTDGLTYVWIPPGTFQMGCSPDDSTCNAEEKPAHPVRLTKGFWIGQTPVTQAAYKKVVGNNPSSFHGDRLPVDSVSWDDANAYCKRLDMSLPTEAEWEYAARAGNGTSRYAPVALIAWYAANSGSTTHEVGQKQANAYGLYDMLGNVWEWVADWYGPYDAKASQDPKGPPTGEYRTLRGGSWGDDPPQLRVSARDQGEPAGRFNVNGFRCARE